MFWAYCAEKELWNAGCLVHKKGSILACDGVDWPFFCVVLAYFKGNREMDRVFQIVRLIIKKQMFELRFMLSSCSLFCIFMLRKYSSKSFAELLSSSS